MPTNTTDLAAEVAELRGKIDSLTSIVKCVFDPLYDNPALRVMDECPACADGEFDGAVCPFCGGSKRIWVKAKAALAAREALGGSQ